jgi:hypothetical protein
MALAPDLTKASQVEPTQLVDVRHDPFAGAFGVAVAGDVNAVAN